MVDYIDALPYGRIVLDGIKDDGSLNMTENAYLALESLGSVACRDVGYRDSHAFIGRVGVMPGTVEEEHVPSSSGPAEVEVHKVDCRVQSAGFDDGFLVNLFVNGVDVGTNGRGHNLVVIDESTGQVLNTVSYDTYASSTAADAMATFINGLANGRIVLAGISDDGSVSMTENAYQALESLGSAATRNVAYRNSWAMIGVKGAAIGSVPEQHVPRFAGYAEVSQEAPSVHLVDGFHFYYTDHLNSTRMLDDWDPGQAEIQVDYYYPFGEINTQSGGGEDTHYKFTGYEEDAGIGLHYAKARFYNPGLGRFLTPDPAGQYFSPYVYVGNRPLVYVDPDGEFFVPILVLAAWQGFISYQITGNIGSSLKAAGISAVGGLAGGFAASFAPAGVLPGFAYGAASGGIVGGGVSVLSGSSFSSGLAMGAISGGITGGLAGYEQAVAEGWNIWTGDKPERPTIPGVQPIAPRGLNSRRQSGLVRTAPLGTVDVPQLSPIQNYYENALSFEGVPYVSGGTGYGGLDCSGLVCAAIESDIRWVARDNAIPPGNWSAINTNNTSMRAFLGSVRQGDLFVWYGTTNPNVAGHAAFYAGGNRLFHAHGLPGTPTGFTGDLIRYYLRQRGYPNVFRQQF